MAGDTFMGMTSVTPEQEQRQAVVETPAPVVTPMPTSTPPPVETPAIADIVPEKVEPTVEPTPAPAVVTPEVISELGYKSVEELKSSIEQYKELQKKVAELEGRDPDQIFADPYVKSLNQALRDGKSKETFDRAYFSDPTKMSEAEKVALNLQIELGLTAEKANEYVNSKYKLGEDYDIDDPAVRDARLELMVEAKKADRTIEQFRSKELAPAPDVVAQNLQTWSPVIPKLVEPFKELTIEGIETKFKVSQDSLDKAAQLLKDVVANKEFNLNPSDPKDLDQINDLIMSTVMTNERKSYDKFLMNEIEKRHIKEKSNVPPATPEKAPTGRDERAEARHIFKQMNSPW